MVVALTGPVNAIELFVLPKVIPITVFCGSSGESDIAVYGVTVRTVGRKGCSGRQKGILHKRIGEETK